MRSNRKLLAIQIVLVFILGVAICPLAVRAQTEGIGSEGSEKQSATEAETKSVDLLSDVEQILRHERILELDRTKLEKVRQELEEQQELFEDLGTSTYRLASELEEKREELGQLEEAADPEVKSALEAEIAELEVRLDFFKTQSDLELTTESTLRKQIESLEKKLERHQRAVDKLRGVTPMVAKPAPSPAPEVSAPAGPAIAMPGMPAAPDTGTAPAPVPAKPRLETTAQVEAQRKLERRQAEVEVAEEALVEYVKRYESLQEQIEFETVLLETTERSVDNLAMAVQYLLEKAAEEAESSGEAAEIRELERTAAEASAALEVRRGWIEERQAYLESLQQRMEVQKTEEGLVTQQLEEKRREVKEAEERLYWLQSPIHPANVWRWIRERGPRILLVIVVTAILLLVLRLSAQSVARATVRSRRGERKLTVNRADTLALSFRSAATVLILMGATVLVFQEAGIDVKTVLGGAAILGFALAFGAQNLMRDYFTGFMILLEDQYELGDLITIGSITGTVEKVNMRTTILRDLEGRVHFIPNGEVKSVTNRTYVWGRAVIDVPISYKENVDYVMEVLLQVAEELRADPEFGSFVTDDPVMLGVDKFTEYGVVIKFMIKTLPDKMFPVRRQMLRRVKNKFDEVGIEISVPYRMLLQPEEPVGTVDS